MTDPIRWSQPRFSDYPFLDGTQLSNLVLTDADKNVVLGAPSLFRMANGSAVVQRPFAEDSQAEAVRFYEWVLELDGGEFEADWDLFKKQEARAATVSWIDYDIEHEAFKLAGGSETFTLQRATAVSVLTGFDTTSYPTVALLDGTSQTIVTSGSPSSGEVSVSGSTVVVPSNVTAGQLLEVRYYPAYYVQVLPSGVEGIRYNRLNRSIRLVEMS